MKNRFTRILAFLLIVASLSSFLTIFPSAASELDNSVKMFHNRTYNEGWEYNNGLTAASGLDPFVNHEYDDDFNYNYYVEVSDKKGSLAGGYMTMTIPEKNRPTSGKTVLSLALKLPKESDMGYGTVVSVKTTLGKEYTLLTINKNQLFSFGSLLGNANNDEWIQLQFIMSWDDDIRSCEVKAEGAGISTSSVFPLADGQQGASPATIYIGMGTRAAEKNFRTFYLDDLVLYNVALNVVAKEDLNLYGVGELVSQSKEKTIEIYGTTNLAPTDYIKRGLTMKVGVDSYMTEVVTSNVTGAKAHKKLNIYTAENGKPYGAPVKVDGVVYVPMLLILDYLGYDYKARENSLEISTGGTSSVSITIGSKSAAINGKRVELQGAPGYASAMVGGVEYKYLVVSLDAIELFFAQQGQENPLYVTYDEMGLILLTGKKNVWNRNANLAEMATLMEKFIFDYDYENRGAGFGQQLVEDIQAYSNFSHPYLFANQDRWNTLRAVWLSNDAEAYARLMALTDAQKAELEIENADPDGYSDTLRTWLRDKISLSVEDPGYVAANGEFVLPPDLSGFELPEGLTLTSYERAYAASTSWMILDEEGNYLGMNPSSSYRGQIVNWNYYNKHGDGYDEGGRFNLYVGSTQNNTGDIAGTNTGDIRTFAWYYQMTRDLRYAQLVFDHLSILGDTQLWGHWGPSHFLNCADGTGVVAIAYDWLCPAWDKLYEMGVERPTEEIVLYPVTTVELGTRYSKENSQNSDKTLTLTPPSFPEVTTYDRKHICKIIMDQGVHEGWLSQIKNMTEHPNDRVPSGYEWKSNTDNWNAVCTKGMALGGLMTLEYEEFRAETMELFDEMMYWFFVNGLDEYAPDGAYYESCSYWQYATQACFQMAAAFESAANSDYGIMDCYGFDRTCYYAINVETSDAQLWTYHATGTGGKGPAVTSNGLEGSWTFWVGLHLNDSALCELKLFQIENGLKKPSEYDMIYYDASISAAEEINLPITYYMESMHGYLSGFVVRSSWEKGSMTLQIHGGGNYVPHGDLDAGTFSYWNRGRGWIWDIGGDNYNLYGFWGSSVGATTYATRYRYYKISGEGNNVVLLTSRQNLLPHGQRAGGHAPLQRQHSDENGAFAIYEMIDIYSTESARNSGVVSPLVSAATRGVLATDDYQTVIVQDEILAKAMETFYWFGHFSDQQIEVSFSDDRRVCYMKHNTPNVNEKTGKDHYEVLRITIVSPDSSDKFTVMGSGDEDMVLDATFRNGTHQNYPAEKEYDRSAVRKLCIRRADKTNFRVAVVFEMLPDAFYDHEHGIVTPEDDAYPCSYTWQDMYQWETKPAPEYDFGGDENRPGANEVLAVSDLGYYANIAKKYDAEKTAYSTGFYEFFAAISRVQRAWNRFQGTMQAKPYEQDYLDCEDYFREYSRVQKQMNQSNAAALSTVKTLAGIR